MPVLRYERRSPVSYDFVEDLITALDRVITPDVEMFREVLILSGMPHKTENLRYMSYNRQVVTEGKKIIVFSAVAVINNRRATRWQLAGFAKKISNLVFNTRWTRNPLDLFLNSLRGSPEMIALLDGTPEDYTILGILQRTESIGSWFLERKLLRIRPVIAVPGLDAAALRRIEAFEARNEIRKTRFKGLPISPAT
ncbi:MAG: hypothetical protein K9K88_09115 [Desulfobacterales bacterium]|nr:hypothetical protein [Desulfobacterales bacterium]